jgi:NAD dependent epimerase/dehydratase family enzyme
MFLLRLLFGEMADAVFVASQRVMPAAAEKAGFDFRFTELRPALRDLLRS